MDTDGRTWTERSDGNRPAREMRLDLTDSTGRLPEGDCRWLMDRLAEAIAEAFKREHAEVGEASGEVRVRVVDDAEMSRLHEEFAGVKGTTDVLTFDLSGDGAGGADGGAGGLDVDIAACLDEAERQGRARGHGAREELLLYALHGVLHCLGHDDVEEGEYAEMHEAEDEILSAIGVGVRFARRGAAGGDA